ncbi:MAG: hypothetical protein M1816_000340 [Peltula sp. TS41687]|nr:MAG: hypothetical protein M1816_000340 [Peltula sp. TS41687]
MYSFHLHQLLVLVLLAQQLPRTVLSMPVSPSQYKKDKATTQAGPGHAQNLQGSMMGVPSWPYVVAGLTGLAWNVHRAWLDQRPHLTDRFDAYTGKDELEQELDDHGETYVNHMTACVDEKLEKMFPREGLRLQDLFEDKKMSIAQHRRATWAAQECVAKTNEQIATDRAQASQHMAASWAAQGKNEIDQEHSKGPSKNGNRFGFMDAVGRGILSAEKKVKTIPHGSLGNLDLLPGTPPIVRPLV